LPIKGGIIVWRVLFKTCFVQQTFPPSLHLHILGPRYHDGGISGGGVTALGILSLPVGPVHVSSMFEEFPLIYKTTSFYL
jgi:hypothetical protein